MIPETVIESYGLGHGSIEAINTGLINETWKLSTNNDDFIFQKINPIFPEQIHESIHKITKILLQDDIGSIEIIRTKNGELIHKENNEISRPGIVHRLDKFGGLRNISQVIILRLPQMLSMLLVLVRDWLKCKNAFVM